MNRSKPFLYSLALHASLIALFLGTINAVRHISGPEKSIAVSLLAYTPAKAPDAKTLIPPEPAAVPPPKIDPVTKTQKIPPTIPTAQRLAPPALRLEPSAAAETPLPAPVSAKPAESPSVEAPPPPPVNYQKAYEDENLGRIRTLLAQNLVYPKNAQRLKQQGIVSVMFSISPSGEVNAITITKSSGFEPLDKAAYRLIETTAPQLPKPKKIVQISIPVEYKLR